jgi:uncharacterized membrane protein
MRTLFPWSLPMRTCLWLPLLGALALSACQTTAVRTQPTPVPAPASSAAVPGVVPATPAPPPAAAASPWDDARARGVGFRAVGTEPGWTVEVDKGAAPPMRVVLDYGQRQLQVAHTQPFSDPATGVVGFRGNTADGIRRELTILRGQCQDARGENLEASADLAVGSQHYKGCGRFLFQ